MALHLRRIRTGTLMITLSLLLVASAQARLTDAQRIDAKQAIEKARYQFVIGDKPPFDKSYPRSIFARQVREEHEREEVLLHEFAIAITPEMLHGEYERIEKTSQAPDQWQAVKDAVHNDRQVIEDVVCRPLIVTRALHAKFAFDQKIHAVPHNAARSARAALMRGEKPAGVQQALLSRGDAAADSTEQMLRDSKSEAARPRVLAPPGAFPPAMASAPVPLDPEARAVVEKQLRKPGDVTTILEYSDRFEVYRLIETKPAAWRVDVVRFPKEDFDAWFAHARTRSVVRSAPPIPKHH
jgi:hypothetical protein